MTDIMDIERWVRGRPKFLISIHDCCRVLDLSSLIIFSLVSQGYTIIIFSDLSSKKPTRISRSVVYLSSVMWDLDKGIDIS